jgi:hypothetical protein
MRSAHYCNCILLLKRSDRERHTEPDVTHGDSTIIVVNKGRSLRHRYRL